VLIFIKGNLILPVLRIHEILAQIQMRIWIHRFIPVTNDPDADPDPDADADPDPDPAVYVSDLQDINQKLIFLVITF
jgi:hypothetical protein